MRLRTALTTKRRKRRLYAGQDVKELVLEECASCLAAGGPDVSRAVRGKTAESGGSSSGGTGSASESQEPDAEPEAQASGCSGGHGGSSSSDGSSTLAPVGPVAAEPFFPLEIFDDTMFETRLPREWVPEAAGEHAASLSVVLELRLLRRRRTVHVKANDAPSPAGAPRPPARVAMQAAHGAGVEWRQAVVLDCRESDDMYLVQLKDAPGAAEGASSEAGPARGAGSGGGCGGEQTPPAPFWLPRVCVCFAAEDPAVYARRYVAAHAARTRAEALMRYSLCLDCMPTDGLPQLTTEQVTRQRRVCMRCCKTADVQSCGAFANQTPLRYSVQVNRILGLALNTKQLRDRLMDTSTHMTDANLAHARAMNKVRPATLVVHVMRVSCLPCCTSMPLAVWG